MNRETSRGVAPVSLACEAFSISRLPAQPVSCDDLLCESDCICALQFVDSLVWKLVLAPLFAKTRFGHLISTLSCLRQHTNAE